MQFLSFLFFLATLMVGLTVLIAEIRIGADRIFEALAGQSSPAQRQTRPNAFDTANVTPIRLRAFPEPIAPLPLAA